MYIDILTQIKNAQGANQESIKVPFSNMDLAVLEVLEKNQFVESVSKKGRMPKRIIEVRLKYKNGEGAIHGVKFYSKPSRRLYASYQKIKPVRQGVGLVVVSTSKGIMDGREARKQKVGGQLLFEIW
jgi:small subunit ribosomal protein S8